MKAPKYITIAQAEQLATHTDDERGRLLIRVLTYTGARVSEALALTTSEVDLQQRTLSIPWLKTRRKKNGQTPDTEPQHQRRRIPIAAALLSDLSSLVAGTSPPVIGRGLKPAGNEGRNDTEPGQRLFPFSRITAYRIIRDASLRSAIRTQDGRLVHPHALRHTFAIHWIQHGGKIEMLQRFLGHSDSKTTSIYLQFAPHDLMQEQDRIFGGPHDQPSI